MLNHVLERIKVHWTAVSGVNDTVTDDISLIHRTLYFICSRAYSFFPPHTTRWASHVIQTKTQIAVHVPYVIVKNWVWPEELTSVVMCVLCSIYFSCIRIGSNTLGVKTGSILVRYQIDMMIKRCWATKLSNLVICFN